MPIMTVGTGMALFRGNYNERVLATQPIFYVPENESAGAISYCLTNPAMNGAYTAVTLANDPTGPFEMPAPYYDGATSYNDIYSIPLNANLTGAECTIGIWGRVDNVGIWTDGTFRAILILYVDVNNSLILRRSNANNTFSWLREGGGVAQFVNLAGLTTTDWFFAALTVSEAADEWRAYWNGAQAGVTQVGLGAWAGNLNPLLCLIGAQNQAPANVWNGRIGPGGVWSRALPPAEIASLSRDLRMV